MRPSNINSRVDYVATRESSQMNTDKERAIAHTVDAGRVEKKALQSITEETDLDTILAEATLADREFSAERERVVVLETTAVNATPYQTLSDDRDSKLKYQDLIKIPRRPARRDDINAEQLFELEHVSFLQWRKSLAVLEEQHNVLMTPFERNIEIWRQLWRVVERAELVVQIVDARNPLQFRCPDLERYVREQSNAKRNLLLLNKADFLTLAQRKAWSQYLNANGIRHIFFSAANEQAILNAEYNRTKAPLPLSMTDLHQFNTNDNTNDDDNDDDDDEEEEDAVESDENNDTNAQQKEINGSHSHQSAPTPIETENNDESDNENNNNDDKDDENNNSNVETTPIDSSNANLTLENARAIVNTATIANREQLLLLLAAECPESQWRDNSNAHRVVGFVGYPNVGKSSTINVLVGQKKTGVTATPGKTKHFQTLLLTDDLMLCDCPGLVMPSLASTQAQMYLDGLLPIDRMRNYVQPATLLCARIGRARLERTYGIVLSDGAEGSEATLGVELLQAWAYARGYMTGRGLPDESRAARYIIKDYVSGVLLHCAAPPGRAQWTVAELAGGRAEPCERPERPYFFVDLTTYFLLCAERKSCRKTADGTPITATYIAPTLAEYESFSSDVKAYTKSRKTQGPRTAEFTRRTTIQGNNNRPQKTNQSKQPK